MVLGKIIGVFALVFIGFGANKLGWLPADASKYISKIVINIAAPCVVISSMSVQELSKGDLKTLLILIGIGAVQYLFSIGISFLSVRIMRIDEENKGIFRNFLIFTNNGFMGFPVALAIFGAKGMFYMVLVNCLNLTITFTLGVQNLKRRDRSTSNGTGRGRRIVKFVLDPPILSMLLGFVLLFAQVRLPVAVMDVLDAVGSMMAPLAMMVIGLQLTSSKPRAVMTNHKLIIMCAIRLLVIPGLLFLMLLPFYHYHLITGIEIGVVTLSAMLPCATVSAVLAEEYGRNARLAAEGIFLSTLFSMLTIPVAGVFLSML